MNWSMLLLLELLRLLLASNGLLGIFGIVEAIHGTPSISLGLLLLGLLFLLFLLLLIGSFLVVVWPLRLVTLASRVSPAGVDFVRNVTRSPAADYLGVLAIWLAISPRSG